ncbi:MAG: carbon-nitrogen hydrolase family protein [Chloroflexi bacterium]|nr:carbon-nitrogen hydrolase family protein [Chloroflexota bacterium]
MRVCLVPFKTLVRNPNENLKNIAKTLSDLVIYQPDLVCFPECTLTGYLFKEDDFEKFAQSISGTNVCSMSHLASTYSTYISFGMLERGEEGIYDTALLLDRAGKIIFKHRKIEEKPPFINGNVVNSIATEFGRLGIIICGDLFNEDVVKRLDSKLNYLLIPMSRGFDGQSPDIERWIVKERHVYINAVKNVGCTSFLVNALEVGENPSFGGAMIVDADGRLLAESHHGTDEILIYDF